MASRAAGVAPFANLLGPASPNKSLPGVLKRWQVRQPFSPNLAAAVTDSG
jgi:hypothetical protein